MRYGLPLFPYFLLKFSQQVHLSASQSQLFPTVILSKEQFLPSQLNMHSVTSQPME